MIWALAVFAVIVGCAVSHFFWKRPGGSRLPANSNDSSPPDTRNPLPLPPITAPAPTPKPEPMAIANITTQLTRHPTKRFPTRSLSDVELLIVHHSATTSGSAEAFAQYHVRNLGWPGIGYHFVVDKDGSVRQTNALTSVSYHVKNQNTRAIGICCVGHYDQQTPPEAQLRSLISLLKLLKNRLPGVSIRGHRDFSAKSCPGRNFPLDEVVRKVSTPQPPSPSAPSTSSAAATGSMILLPIGVAVLWLLNR